MIIFIALGLTKLIIWEEKITYVKYWNNSKRPYVIKYQREYRRLAGGRGIQRRARSMRAVKDQKQLYGRWSDILRLL